MLTHLKETKQKLTETNFFGQVLTHLKEKLQFVQAENQLLKVELAELEAELSTHRDALTRAKHDRDALRAENLRLRGEAGLIGIQCFRMSLRVLSCLSFSLARRKVLSSPLRHARLVTPSSSCLCIFSLAH